jgi:hypothetical protein
MVVMIDSVAGMTKAAPMPITARPHHLVGAGRDARNQRASSEHDEADEQRTLFEPVAQCASGEQEPAKTIA